MKKVKKINMIFIILCFLICIIPSVGLLIFHAGNTKKEEHVTFPVVTENGKINIHYLSELGAYFENSFALRSSYIDVDAKIQSDIFKVSNNDSVIAGKHGWLYYASSLDDYLGQNVLSDRGVYNIENNVSLLEEYIESRGVTFLFTISPNKNSLYGENMPSYYQKKASSINNLAKLEKRLAKGNVKYCSLYDVFKNQGETLYLKRDSHWNNKGAMLAYHTLLTNIEFGHESYETTKAIRTKTNIGDLNEMMFPESAKDKTDWNYDYQYKKNYSFTSKSDDVEDEWLATENKTAKKSLLMFRDSFGNTLIPLMSNAFGKAYYSKDATYNIEELLDKYSPEYVIAEKVERNISEYAKTPAVMSAPERIVDGSSIKTKESYTTIAYGESETDADYYEISGKIDHSVIDDTSDVYVKITDGKEKHVYEAFTLTDDKSDDLYCMYMKKANVKSPSLKIEIILKDGNQYTSVATKTLELK